MAQLHYAAVDVYALKLVYQKIKEQNDFEVVLHTDSKVITSSSQ